MDFSFILLFSGILLIGFVLCCIQYFRFYLMKGDFEDKEDVYSNIFSFNKTLNIKMKYYSGTHNMKWLKFYMNVILLAFSVLGVYGFINLLIKHSANLIDTILIIVFALTTVCNFIFFRFIDKSSFWINILSNIYFIIFMSIEGNPIPTSPFNGFVLLGVIIWGIIILFNLVYFIKRKDLFFKTAKQMKSELSDIT